MVVSGHSNAAGNDGSAVLVQELRNFKADILASLFSLGTIQLAAVDPAMVAPAKAAEALEEMRVRANEALDAKRTEVSSEAAEGSEAQSDNGEVESESGDEDKGAGDGSDSGGSDDDEGSDSDEEEEDDSDVDMSAE